MIILLFIVAFYNISTAVAISWLSSVGAYSFTGVCTYDLLKEAASQMYTIINGRMIPSFSDILHTVHSIELYSGYSYKVTSLEGLDVYQRLTFGFDVILSPLVTIRYAAILFIASASFQLLTLELIRFLGYDLLLPLAIAMRFFPPTRGAANEVLAALFSFVIVMPFLYLLLIPTLDKVFIYQGLGSIYSFSKFSTGPLSFFSIMQNLGLLLFKYGVITNILFTSFVLAVDHFAYSAIVGTVLPTFIITISITFVGAFREVLEFK